MTTPRKPLTRDERHARAILMIRNGIGESVIDQEWAKTATPRDIVDRFEKMFHDDHRIPRGLGGSEHVSNRQPLSPEDHREKTKRDVKTIAKSKRVEKAQDEFRAKILARTFGEDAPPNMGPKKKDKKTWSGRKMPCGRSSPFTKKMSGAVVRRAKPSDN